ncbi:MAG: ribonuclease III [Bacteroidales bacterium]|nr:ribonuclease III [Bacteroidales bacterium]
MVRILGFLPRKLFLYEIAFIHKSASTTLKNGQVINNERLEYLGDAILDAVIADYLYTRFPDKNEGFLTQLRAKLVKRKMLNKLADNVGIAPLLVSRTNADQSKVNLLGNAFEALIGAIYLDKGYVRTKRYVIKKVLNKYVDLEKLSRKESDFKSRIIEWAQKNKHEISFVSREDSSEGSNPIQYTAKLILEEKEMGTGNGYSKKEAEQKAAEQALNNIDQ